MPALYAPLAPVIRQTFPPHWSLEVNQSGLYWPCVFASADLARGKEHLALLDSILDLPPQELRKELVRLRHERRKIDPCAFLPHGGATKTVWTADPYYPLSPTSEAR